MTNPIIATNTSNSVNTAPETKDTTLIHFSDEEARLFGFALESELHDLVNEWDDDICRKPSAARYAMQPALQNLFDKWLSSQPQAIRKTNFGTMLIVFDEVVACDIPFTDEDAEALKSLSKHYEERDNNALAC